MIHLPAIDESIFGKGLKALLERKESEAWYIIVDHDMVDELRQSESIELSGIALWADLDSAVQIAESLDAKVLVVSGTAVNYNNLHSAVQGLNWRESVCECGLAAYWGNINGKIAGLQEVAQIEPDDEVITEGKRASKASSERLKKIVLDRLNKSKAFRNHVKKVKVTGKKMEVHLGKEKHVFNIERNHDGWINGIEHVEGNKRRLKNLTSHVGDSFQAAHFEQVIADSGTGDQPRLIMLDYTRLDGGRRTRLVEAYSYRYRASTGRTYFYGWNVEEGGIRSYITSQIHGARITEKKFNPRFMIEVGKNPTQDGPKIIDKKLPHVVTKAFVKRAHQRFELAGGRGKIVRRLGHSVTSSKPKKSNA